MARVEGRSVFGGLNERTLTRFHNAVTVGGGSIRGLALLGGFLICRLGMDVSMCQQASKSASKHNQTNHDNFY